MADMRLTLFYTGNTEMSRQEPLIHPVKIPAREGHFLKNAGLMLPDYPSGTDGFPCPEGIFPKHILSIRHHFYPFL